MGGVAAAVLPIAGPLVGGLIGGITGQNAADTQAQGATNAANIAANAQLQGLQFVQGQEAPYNQAGQLALGQYEQLLGLGGGGYGGGGGPSYRPTPGGGVQQILSGGGGPRAIGSPGGVGGGSSGMNFDVSKLPGYQFELGQGLNAIQNSAAARGGALTGNTLQGLEQFGQGLASTQFQQYMQQLAGLANMGQAAASGVANQGATLLSGAGASLASGVNAAAGYNAAGQVGLGNTLQGVFNAPQVQGGLQSLFSPGNLALGGAGVSPGGDIGNISQSIINSGALP